MTWNSASGEMVFFSFCPWLSAISTFLSSSVMIGPESERPAERVSRLPPPPLPETAGLLRPAM